MTKKQFINRLIFIAIAFLIFSATWYVKFPHDALTESDRGELKFGFMHTAFSFVSIITLLVFFVHAFYNVLSDGEWDFEDEGDVETKTTQPIKYRRYIILGVVALVLYSLYSFYSDSKTIYNTSIQYHNNYTQKVQEKQGFYDKLWKTYLQKEKITNLNKETFLTVTSLIMENRKDGSSVAWKWVQENQQIPYDEFTRFYAGLSSFIETQREGYFKIEMDCQKIANQNNTLLDTLPNNIYNKVIGCKRIDFQYGFLSDSTRTVFKNKTENVK